MSVSYTHLDVYKRQILNIIILSKNEVMALADHDKNSKA